MNKNEIYWGDVPYLSPLSQHRANEPRMSEGNLHDNSIQKLKKRKRRARTSKHNLKPIADRCCDWCAVTETPEWRSGPEENKYLCNACGLQYRIQLKKATRVRDLLSIDRLLNTSTEKETKPLPKRSSHEHELNSSPTYHSFRKEIGISTPKATESRHPAAKNAPMKNVNAAEIAQQKEVTSPNFLEIPFQIVSSSLPFSLWDKQAVESSSNNKLINNEEYKKLNTLAFNTENKQATLETQYSKNPGELDSVFIKPFF